MEFDLMKKFVNKCKEINDVQCGSGVTTRKGTITKHANEETTSDEIAAVAQEAPKSPIAGPSHLEAKVQNINWERIEDETTSESSNISDNFSKKDIIFENNELIVYVTRQMFKRQKRFRLEDHLYVLRFQVKTSKPPLISSLLDLLKKSFLHMTNCLKAQYDAAHKNLIYLSIFQRPMTK